MKQLLHDLPQTIELMLTQCDVAEVEVVSIEKVCGRVLAEDVYVKELSLLKDNTHVQLNQPMLEKGTYIDPIVHTILADTGRTHVQVFCIPVIGIAIYQKTMTPEELENEGYHQNDINRFLISDILKQYGFMTLYLGTFADSPLQNTVDIKMATSMCDALIIYDDENEDCEEMERILAAKSTEVIIDKLKFQPVASCCVNLVDDMPIFGLAGKTAEINTAVQLLVTPVLKRMAGYKDGYPERVMVELQNDYEKMTEPSCIIWGKLNILDGVLRMETRHTLIDHSIVDLRDVDVFAIAPKGAMILKRGTLLDAFVIK